MYKILWHAVVGINKVRCLTESSTWYGLLLYSCICFKIIKKACWHDISEISYLHMCDATWHVTYNRPTWTLLWVVSMNDIHIMLWPMMPVVCLYCSGNFNLLLCRLKVVAMNELCSTNLLVEPQQLVCAHHSTVHVWCRFQQGYVLRQPQACWE